MTEHAESESSAAYEWRLSDLWYVIARQRLVVCAACVLALLIATAYLHIATKKYAVTLRLAPATGQSNQPSGTFNNLALTGIHVGGVQQSDPFDLFISGIRLGVYADRLAKDQNIMQIVFPLEWSGRTHSWHEPPHSFLHYMKNGIYYLFGIPVVQWEPPTVDRLRRAVMNLVTFTQDRDSSIVSLSTYAKQPADGEKLLSAVYKATDETIRSRELARASNYANYLSARLQTVTGQDYRNALTTTLIEQEKVRMMASSSLPFAAESFLGPVPSAVPVQPNGTVVLGLSLVLGLCVGIGAAFILDHYGVQLDPRWMAAARLRLRRSGTVRQ